MTGAPKKQRKAPTRRPVLRAPSPEPRTPSSAARATGHGPRVTVLPELRFDAHGLVPAVVQDAETGAVLMLGYMDREALGATLESGEVHFHSRSRGVLWRKGETSGNVLRLVSVAADCDGDALLVRARPAGPTCHTGETSCFHREIPGTGDRGPGTGRTKPATAVIAGELAGGNPVDNNVIAPPSAGQARSPAGGGATKQSPCAGEIASLSGPPPADRTPRLSCRRQGNDGGAEERLEGLTLAPLFAVLKDRAKRRPDGSYTVKLLDNEDKALKKLIEEAGEVALAVKNRDRANLVWELADVLYHLAVIMVAQGIAPADVNAELARRAGETR